MLKLDELSRALTYTQRELEKLQEDYDSERRSHTKLLEENESLQKKVATLEVLASEHQRFKQQVDKLHEENTFYVNEVGIYKNQVKHKEAMVDELTCRIREL